jgi:hypothetical protein
MYRSYKRLVDKKLPTKTTKRRKHWELLIISWCSRAFQSLFMYKILIMFKIHELSIKLFYPILSQRWRYTFEDIGIPFQPKIKCHKQHVATNVIFLVIKPLKIMSRSWSKDIPIIYQKCQNGYLHSDMQICT